MPRPDFGNHVEDFESGGRTVKLSCKYIAPGLTMHDLANIWDAAVKEAKPEDALSGNPSKWPTNRGLHAISEAILKSIYGE